MTTGNSSREAAEVMAQRNKEHEERERRAAQQPVDRFEIVWISVEELRSQWQHELAAAARMGVIGILGELE